MLLKEMVDLSLFLGFIQEHGIIFSFLAGFITGESVIILLAFLSATGFLPWYYVLIFCTLGMYLSDFVPFTAGRFRFLRKFLEKKSIAQKVDRVEFHLIKYTKNNIFLILFYTKIIYGASIPALIYLGFKKIPYRKFAVYNLLVELIFVPAIFLIGWASGKGFALAMLIFENARIGIFLVIVIIFALILTKRWINQWLIKRQKL
jgi:membrane protein DedA with SNARE-associated domain